MIVVTPTDENIESARLAEKSESITEKNGNGIINPLDALPVINDLGKYPNGKLPDLWMQLDVRLLQWFDDDFWNMSARRQTRDCHD